MLFNIFRAFLKLGTVSSILYFEELSIGSKRLFLKVFKNIFLRRELKLDCKFYCPQKFIKSFCQLLALKVLGRLGWLRVSLYEVAFSLVEECIFFARGSCIFLCCASSRHNLYLVTYLNNIPELWFVLYLEYFLMLVELKTLLSHNKAALGTKY